MSSSFERTVNSVNNSDRDNGGGGGGVSDGTGSVILVNNESSALVPKKSSAATSSSVAVVSNPSSVGTSPSQLAEPVPVSSDTDGSSDYRSSRNNSTTGGGSTSRRSAVRYSGTAGGGGGEKHGSVGAQTPTYFEIDEDDDDRSDDDDVDDEDNDGEGGGGLFDVSLAYNFMMEHRIFLRAGLDLLNERDRHAPELGMMDPIVLKSGPLKKASQLMNGVWKVKYVEIRRGMFSYFENNVTSSKGDGQHREGELLRKNIPLEASTVTCRAVKLHQKALKLTPTGAIFELTYTSHHHHNHHHMSNDTTCSGSTGDTGGGSGMTSTSTTTKRFWMANSREERSKWIQAINNAMVGGSVTRGDAEMDHHGFIMNVNARSPYKNDLRIFLKAQNLLRNAKTKQDYVNAIKENLNRRSLQIPIKWIAKQQESAAGADTVGGGMSGAGGGAGDGEVGAAFREETVAMSIDQLWKDLHRDSVSIDDVFYSGESLHGPERIFGALTKRILAVASSQTSSSAPNEPRRSAIDNLRESQALEYARDILLAGNRTRSAGDSYYCVNALCSNMDLVVIVPSNVPVTPVSFKVSEDESFQSRFVDKSGWIKTRSYLQRSGWTKLFFVLSEGTLSYYAGALPRPHGLRGQRFLREKASISISKKKKSRPKSRTLSIPATNDKSGKHSVSPVSTHPYASFAGNKDEQQEQYILTISSDDNMKDRMLLFESEDKLFDWVYALECVLKSNEISKRKQLSRRRLSGSNDVKGGGVGSTANDEGGKEKLVSRRRFSGSNAKAALSPTEEVPTTSTPAPSSATPAPASARSVATTALTSQQGVSGSSTNTNNNQSTSIIDILSRAAQATKAHAEKVGLDDEALDNRLGTYARRATSAVCVTVTACTKYNICTLDPEGDERLDTWAKIDANFLQSFRVTGGPNGRIIRGEETVCVTVTEYGDKATNGNIFPEDTISTNPTPDLSIPQAQHQQQQASQSGGTTATEGTLSPVNVPTNTTSPPSNRGRINRLTFLRFGSSDDLETFPGGTTSASDGAVGL